MRKLLFLLICLAGFAGSAAAQKGTAEGGYYPLDFAGETFTGVVTAINEDAREFTLTYKNKKGTKEESHTFVLTPKFTLKRNDGREFQVEVADLKGLHLTVYFINKTKKENGVKVKYKEAFKIKQVVDK